MDNPMLFKTVGGLGMFLFGMGLMSDGLKKIAGQKMRSLLASLTKHRVIAVLVGAMVTCLIQSSSATTVMTVGFVNAGLLSLKQALCVVLGANVGTTITAWIVSTLGIGSLKITAYALPAVGIGFALNTLGRNQKWRSIGIIILGFGVLFIGIDFMKDAFEPLKDSQQVNQWLIWLGHNPILAVLAGTIITVLLQSSSASIAMVQLLAFQGAFGTDWSVAFNVAVPFILGDNIGTTITAQLAALRANRNSKRAAIGHTFFNLIGVLYILPFVATGLFGNIVESLTPFELTKGSIMVHIALAHTIFNVFNTLLFIPIIRGLEKVVMLILPASEDELEEKPVVLEKHLLDTPVIALDQARREIIRMAKRAKKACQRSVDGLLASDKRSLEKVMRSEDLLDEFQHEITGYLVTLSRGHLMDEVSVELPILLHTVNDLERIGDHAVNIVEIAERKVEQHLDFSDEAMDEATELKNEVLNMFDHVIDALENSSDHSARSALVNEQNINRLQMVFRHSHVKRMSDGTCDPQTGLIFIDLVDNVEKIGDHLTNISQAVIGGLQWDGMEAKGKAKEAKAKTLSHKGTEGGVHQAG